VVFLDLNLSQENGLDVLQIFSGFATTEVIIFTAFASIDTAVEAMRRGLLIISPSLSLPIRSGSPGACRKTRRLETVAELESRVARKAEIDLETENEDMKKVLDVAFKAANSDTTILLLGKTARGRVCWPGHSSP